MSEEDRTYLDDVPIDEIRNLLWLASSPGVAMGHWVFSSKGEFKSFPWHKVEQAIDYFKYLWQIGAIKTDAIPT